MVEADGKEMKGVEDVRLGKLTFFNSEHDSLDTTIASRNVPFTTLIIRQQLYVTKHLIRVLW